MQSLSSQPPLPLRLLLFEPLFSRFWTDFEPILSCFLDRFLDCFFAAFGPLFEPLFSAVFWTTFELLFWADFGPLFCSLWTAFLQFFGRFFGRFFAAFGALFEPLFSAAFCTAFQPPFCSLWTAFLVIFTAFGLLLLHFYWTLLFTYLPFHFFRTSSHPFSLIFTSAFPGHLVDCRQSIFQLGGDDKQQPALCAYSALSN